eukprot:ANDGO_04980.mRNA.1 hypothetical protein DICPUDRAFT_96740
MPRAFYLCALLFVLVLAIRAQTPPSDPSFDHQTSPYTASIPVFRASGVSATVTPIFSPTDTIGTLTNMVENAKKWVVVATPGFSSWSGCTDWSTQKCVGCNITYARNGEEFPIFRALLNAVHRGVNVRILTNNYEQPACPGMIDPLTFLQLAGAKVRYFTTVTFIHLKFIATDNNGGSDARVSVSSVNFSYTSFMSNREAGMIIEDSPQWTNYLMSIVELDWDQATDLVPGQTYSADDMKTIADESYLNPDIPSTKTFSCNVGKSLSEPITGTFDVVSFASPDSALDSLMYGLNSTKGSITISMYQINDDDMCSKLIDMHQSGIHINMIVSDHIFDQDDYETTQQCYKKLYAAGISFKKTDPKCLRFNHEKFWIVDGTTVFLSSGNWSPTDYPSGSMTFTTFASNPNTWRKANRDITLAVTNPQIVSIFNQIFQIDFEDGFTYTG